MSLTPQNQVPDITDALDGNLTDWYEQVTNCFKLSECIPGKYEYSNEPGYGTQCPIQEGGSIKIDIKCSRFEIIDIDNSYIDFTFEAPITIPKQIDTATEQFIDNKPNIYFTGWKRTYDLIGQYNLYSNGDLIYTQNNPHYESFIDYVNLTDSAKEQCPYITTQEKIQDLNPNVAGIYVICDNTADMVFPLKIRNKIPLNAFPALRNQKYWAGFNNVLTIEILPTYKNLVWSVVEQSFKWNEQPWGALNAKRINSAQAIQNFAADNLTDWERTGGAVFTQINCENVSRYYESRTDNSIGFGYQTFSCASSTLTEFKLYTAKYMIKMDVYNALEMNYLQIPFLFPIQSVSAVKFTSALGYTNDFTLQNTATLSHCDTIYIVFPRNSNERTISYNPEIRAQLSINGVYYPKERLSTNGSDVRFTNLIHDALNINNNPLMTPGKDITTSFRPYNVVKRINTTDNYICDLIYFGKGDRSNFFYGVPLSTDEDFMGGISSNGQTVQIELVGSRDGIDPALNAVDFTEAPIAIFLQDDILKMYAMKPPGKPQIQITHAELPQIIASGGAA